MSNEQFGLLAACRSVAEIASFYKIPMISWVATDPDLNDKIMYSTLSRTLGPFSKLGDFMLEVFSQYKWRRVVVVSSNYLLYLDAAKAIKKVFQDANITVAYQSDYNRYPPEPYITKVLTKIRTEGRSELAPRLPYHTIRRQLMNILIHYGSWSANSLQQVMQIRPYHHI